MHSTMAALIGLCALLLPHAAQALTPPDDPLVEVDWLAPNLNDPGLRIYDLRSARDYAAGHIPGAVNLPAGLLADQPPRADQVAPIAAIKRVFSDKGVDKNQTLVLYDDGALVLAARAFWVFELYGHDRVLLLDGGINAWKKHGLTLATEPVRPAPTDFEPTVRPARLATKFSTRLAIENPRIDIIDARSRHNYADQGASFGVKPGHIPSAVHIPSDDLFARIDGIDYLKPKAEIQAMFSAFDRRNKLITYCTAGSKSAITYFNLRRLGYDAANYDGSWKEWSSDPSLPVALPAEADKLSAK